MNATVPRLVVQALIGLLVAVPAAEAQDVATSFQDLANLVQTGAAIDTIDVRGRKTSGRLLDLSSESIELLVPTPYAGPRAQPVRLPASDIERIWRQKDDSVWNGGVFGAVIGAALRVAWLRQTTSGCDCSWPYFAAAFVAPYAGAGLAIGMFVDSKLHARSLVYQKAAQAQ